MKNKIIAALLLLTSHLIAAQQYQQVVKGQVLDADSKKPLQFATVSMANGTMITDSSGYFHFSDIPLGRQMARVSLTGYEPSQTEVIVIAGKESFITVLLTEHVRQLQSVVITSSSNRTRALNEFASASARSFSVEETKRYAAAAYDPARMAMNFAGVSSNSDMNNEIVVRGNSPKGMLWRLEGIEIPNPNHFSALGNSGGAISMLSSSTLGRSDFYTGAFPAEFGSATSGVLDLNFRNGNNQKREYAVMVGGLGIEAAAEGPFSKNGNASYLVNYRYSTLSLLKGFLRLGGIVPDYQDISYKFHFPTKKAGTFSLFGLGGLNKANKEAVKDSTVWSDHNNHNFILNSRGRTGVSGISHQIFLNDRSYIKTIVAASWVDGFEKVDTLNPRNEYNLVERSRVKNEDQSYRASILYNNKISVTHVIKAGIIGSQMKFAYSNKYYDTHDQLWKEILKADGASNYIQGYFQWKFRVSDRLTIMPGIHASYLTLNRRNTLEPRLSATYKPSHTQSFHIAAGLHARPEHLSTYFFSGNTSNADSFPNRNLNIPKAAHLVAGMEQTLVKGWRMKVEAYYQHLYHIPVEQGDNAYFSMLNAASIEDFMYIGNLVGSGTGRNYGIDITLEKPFSRNYYSMLTASAFNSTYTTYGGAVYNTRYNRNYQMNWVTGKEWKFGTAGKNVFGLNGKLLTSGGLKESPIDLEASKAAGKVQYIKDQYYSASGDQYFRLDAGISYKINKKFVTHTLSFDIQNFTNKNNVFYSWYDEHKQEIRKIYQMGLFPIVNYRIEF